MQHIVPFCGIIGEGPCAEENRVPSAEWRCDPINDLELIRLYRNGTDSAITESERRYGAYCLKIALNVLGDAEDARECVNDVWLKAWNGIPTDAPSNLQAYFGKLTRELAIDRWRRAHSEKRGGGEVALCLDELSECVPAKSDVEAIVEQKELARMLRRFLATLEETPRRVFVCRYWYFDTVREIAARFGFSRSKTTSMLHRTRKQLKTFLKECGYDEIL